MEMAPFGLSTITKGTLRKNAATLEFFADADNGDDANDGRSWATAKQTIAGVNDIIPYVISSPSVEPFQKVVLHLKGTFTLADSNTWIEHFVDGNGTFLITGTDDVTIVDDNGGSNYTASGSSTSSLSVASPVWTVDQHAGYIVQILSGAAAGQSRTVQKNTTTTITPTRNWSTNPGACTFRFVKPATTINTAVGDGQFLYISSEGMGSTVIQKITFDTEVSLSFAGNGTITQCHCVLNAGMYSVGPSPDHGGLSFAAVCYNVTDPFAADSLQKCGVGWIDNSISIDIYRSKVSFAGSVLPVVAVRGSVFSSTFVAYGTRINQLTVVDCRSDSATAANIKNWTNYAAILIDQGMKFISSSVNLGALTISNVTGSAIEAEDTRLRFLDVVAGTGNTKAGLYVWGRSYVTFLNGKTPTVTGTVGDVSINNSTQKSTWAAIAGGTPVNDTTEMVVVKKV